MSKTEAPLTPEGLQTLWGERDERYATRKTPLTESQEQVIRLYRMKEVYLLPPMNRVAVWARVVSWTTQP